MFGSLVAFVAFCSDVEHEVLQVISGYGVTLTYNLYFDDTMATSINTLSAQIDGEMDVVNDTKQYLSSLLADPAFLPKGGYIAVRLLHKYPFSTTSITVLANVEKRLKESDEPLKQAC